MSIIPLLSFISIALILFLSSQALITHLLKLFTRLSKSQETAINLLFFLLLPGIFLHEFSHILSATLLQVPTGHLSLKPVLKNNHLTLGSAQIAHTDPLRLTLIGTAPFITGTLSLWLILNLGLNLNPSTFTLTSLTTLTHLPFYLLLLFGYLLFTISNTMFSSPSDLQSAAYPIILFLIILGIFKLTNLNLPLPLITYSSNFLILLATTFSIVLVLNLIILLPLKFLSKNMLN
jgi:hypothetical protein